MTQSDYRRVLQNLVNELRWRVDTHHNDGENLEGEELTAFSNADQLLSKVREPSAAVSTGSAPTFPLGFNVNDPVAKSFIELQEADSARTQKFKDRYYEEAEKCQFDGSMGSKFNFVFPGTAYAQSPCDSLASWEVQLDYTDPNSPMTLLCASHFMILPYKEDGSFYRIRGLK